MTVALPSTPPVAATAGDTWSWTDTNSLYPASDSWVLAYRIAGLDVLTWDASWAAVTGDTTTLTIPATTTARLRAGRYAVYAEYTLAGVRHTVAHDPLTVFANPSALTAGANTTWEEKTLDAIECFLSGHLENGVQYYQIGNRQVGSIPLKDLLALRNQLKQIVAQQKQPDNAGFGRPVRARLVETSA